MHLVCCQLIVLRHIKTFVEVELSVTSSSFMSCYSTFFLALKVIIMYIIASQSVLVAYWIIVPNWWVNSNDRLPVCARLFCSGQILVILGWTLSSRIICHSTWLKHALIQFSCNGLLVLLIARKWSTLHVAIIKLTFLLLTDQGLSQRRSQQLVNLPLVSQLSFRLVSIWPSGLTPFLVFLDLLGKPRILKTR